MYLALVCMCFVITVEITLRNILLTLLANIVGPRNLKDVTLDYALDGPGSRWTRFYDFSTVFQSYQNSDWVIMKAVCDGSSGSSMG